MTENSGSPPTPQPKISSPRSGGGGRNKIIAVIVLVIVVAAGFLVVYEKFYQPSTATPSISSLNTAIVGQPYSFNVSTSQKLSSLTVHFGDGTSASANYSSSGKYAFSHTYTQPGNAIVFASAKMSSGSVVNFTSDLYPVTVSPSTSYVTKDSSLGTISYNLSASSAPLISNETVFTPGSSLKMEFGYFTEPVNSSYKVVQQSATVNASGSTMKTFDLPYSWNTSTDAYQVSTTSLNYTFANSGLYVVDLATGTAAINTTTGKYSSSGVLVTHTFLDVAVFNSAKIGTSTISSSQSILVNNELEVGGYLSLDPAIAFDTVSLEPIYNTMLPLVGFNGSSTNSFVPMLAANLPSISNGEINNNTATYTQSYTNQAGHKVTYTVALKPYENFTFKIRNNATWQNGQSVTAWDVAYSFARIMLFDGGAPLTGGWMIAPYYIPGPYYKDNTFYNITNNMTVDNASNSITIHFQNPMTTLELFGLLDFYRVTSASWLQANGAGLAWNTAGFKAYEQQGNEPHYNTYVQNHIMSDGPYKLSYTVPGTEVVLVKNPNYNPPAYGMPAAKIDQVDLKYISSPSTTYLNLKSGAAQVSTIPTSSWNEVNSLQNAGTAKAFTFPTPDVYFYKFNAEVNVTYANAQGLSTPSMNMPTNIFTSENVRKAFAYAYNYTYFLDYQVGNSVFHSTFAQLYAGYLESGVTFQQNYSTISKLAQVPTFDLSMAKQYWIAFANGTEGSNAKVTWNAGTSQFQFNGGKIVIPIFIQSADPVDLEGATTWASNLEKAIPGLTVPVVTLPFTSIIGYSSVAGKNPLSVFWWSLAPAYAYPTDSVGGSEMPRTGGHLGGENITPAWFTAPGNSLANTTQANQLQQLLTWYSNATSTANTSVAGNYFHMINEQFVNMTLIVYTEQIYQYHILSNTLNQNVVVPYEENGLFGNDMLYNFMSYK